MPIDPRQLVRPVLLLIAALSALALLAPLSASAGQDRAAARSERQARRAEERVIRRDARLAHKRIRSIERGSASAGESGAISGEQGAGQPTGQPVAAPLQATGSAPGEPPAKHRSAVGHACSIGVGVSSSVIGAGEPLDVLGRLVCQSGMPVAGQPVTVYERQAGTHAFTIAGSVSSEGDGSYQLTPAAFDVNSVFYVSACGARSKRVAVKVTPQVTLNGSPQSGAQLLVGRPRRLRASVASNNTVTFSGTASPAEPGTTVSLQRESGGTNEGWRRIGRAEVSTGGSYSLTHTFRVPGTVNVRVVVRHRGNRPVASEPLSYVVMQRQNPLLTAVSSSGLVASGEAVTISGHAVGAAKQVVTLMARDRGGFASVAQATTNDSGDYIFAAQVPPQTTLYRVAYDRKTSTGLPIRVTYALTAASSADTVQAGQSVTFSGVALPGQEGHSVYLQAQNASGIGFHIVAEGTLGAGSSYSIAHGFYGPSEQLMRIKVPGDPGYLGVGSQLLKIQVTPAPAAALVAQLPASSLSGERQP
jgi:hypothetical protein